MIHQSSHVFSDQSPIKVSDLLGTDQVENFTVRKIGGDGAVYIGNENVSSISYGFRMDTFEGIYFPKINLQNNPNLYVCGDPGVSFSIFAWQ